MAMMDDYEGMPFGPALSKFIQDVGSTTDGRLNPETEVLAQVLREFQGGNPNIMNVLTQMVQAHHMDDYHRLFNQFVSEGMSQEDANLRAQQQLPFPLMNDLSVDPNSPYADMESYLKQKESPEQDVISSELKKMLGY